MSVRLGHVAIIYWPFTTQVFKAVFGRIAETLIETLRQAAHRLLESCFAAVLRTI